MLIHRCQRLLFIVFLFCQMAKLCAIEPTSETKKLRFFCISLHPATTLEIKMVFEELGHEVYVMSEDHAHVFTFEAWWEGINQELCDRFFEKHKDFLNQFDGFISQLNSTLVPLFEKFDKPIIVVNCQRYEFPLTNKPESWSWLNSSIANHFAKNKLFVVGNSKADQKYFTYYTGLESEWIPTLGFYTKAKYTGKNPFYTVHYARYPSLGYEMIRANKKLMSQSLIGKKNLITELKKPYTYEKLYSYKGIIHFPYQISIMSLFEQYGANVPLFFPSKKFLIKLREKYPDILTEASYCYYDGRVPPAPPSGLNDLTNRDVLQFWIDNADFYDTESMPYIQYFDSFRHLQYLLETVNVKEISEKMKMHNNKRKEMILEKWSTLIDKVAAV